MVGFYPSSIRHCDSQCVPVDDGTPLPQSTAADYGGDYLMPPLEGVSYDPVKSILSVDGCGDFLISPPHAGIYCQGVSYPMQSLGEASNIAAVEGGGWNEADEEDWRLSLPAGLKFRPTDEELIVNYLAPELNYGSSYSRGIIKRADIYDYEPYQLQGLAHDHGDGNMYFYTRVRKIGKFKTERTIKSKKGFWRGSQAPKFIMDQAGNKVGSKRPLAFFIYNDEEEKKKTDKDEEEEKEPRKTSWLMTEYLLPESHNSHVSSQELVLAKIYYHGKHQ